MSKEVDQNKLRRKGKGGGGAVRQEGGGKPGGVRDNFKYHLCPSVKRGVGMARPCRKTCSRKGGLRYQCALALSGGRVGWVPSATTTPHPLS